GDVAVPRDQGPHGSHARAQRHECQQQPGVEEQGALHERADRVEGVGEERGEQQRRTRAHQRQQAPEESAEQTDLGHFSFAASSIVSTNVLSGCAPRMGLPLTTKVGVLVAPMVTASFTSFPIAASNRVSSMSAANFSRSGTPAWRAKSSSASGVTSSLLVSGTPA